MDKKYLFAAPAEITMAEIDGFHLSARRLPMAEKSANSELWL
jgi:hypothetical protein